MAAQYINTITDRAGNSLAKAQAQALDQTGALVTLYADPDLASPIGTAATADENGLVRFFIADGVYTIQHLYSGTTVTIPDVALFDQEKMREDITSANVPLATQEDAETGTSNGDRMSSLRTKQAIDAQVLEPLAGAGGAGMIGLPVDGGTVQNAVDNVAPSVWRRRPFADAALRYPDYEADRIAVGAGYLYPQGFDFDDDGNIYVNIVRSSTGGTVVVAVYDSGFKYLGRFFREAVDLSENIVVRGSPTAGTLKLYVKNNSSLVEYSLGTIPAFGSTIPAGVVKIAGGCDSVFTYNDGLWLIEQGLGDLGSTSRTAFNYYDDDFNFVGRFFIHKNVVGWKTSSSENYPNVPKIQSAAMRGGKVYFGIGGSYIPETAGHPPNPVSDYGIIECSPDGTVLQYGVCDTAAAMERVANLGYPIARIENEGLAVGPDGGLYSLMCTQRTNPGDADTTGILLFRELDMLAPSWEDIPSRYKPSDLSRYEGKVWPRSADGKMRNPVSGAEITTMVQLLDLVVELQLHHVAYYSGAHPLTAITGFPDASENMRIDIYNLNNSTLHARATKATSPRIQQWFRFSGGPDWTSASMMLATSVMLVEDGVPVPPTRAGYTSIYVDRADGNLKVKFGDGAIRTIVVK